MFYQRQNIVHINLLIVDFLPLLSINKQANKFKE